jgi:putative holliday junction resolvase
MIVDESRRSLGIDYGFRRIGLALSDPLGMIARPYGIMDRRTNEIDFARLRDIIQHEQVVKIIIGLPTDAAGGIGPQAGRVIRWAHKFALTLNIPIVFWDETGSSVQAASIKGIHREVRRTSGRSREHVDDAAAAVILQEYLDAGGSDDEPGRPLSTLTEAD